MTPGEFAEKVLGVQLCAELKNNLDNMYAIYKKDPDNFVSDYLRKMNIMARGSANGLTKSMYGMFLLLMFDTLFKEEKKNENSRHV